MFIFGKGKKIKALQEEITQQDKVLYQLRERRNTALENRKHSTYHKLVIQVKKEKKQLTKLKRQLREIKEK